MMFILRVGIRISIVLVRILSLKWGLKRSILRLFVNPFRIRFGLLVSTATRSKMRVCIVRTKLEYGRPKKYPRLILINDI